MHKKILIVDSALRNQGGHNYSYTRALQAALEGQGFPVTVFAHKGLASSLAQETGYHPVFSCGAYDFAPGHGLWRDLAYVRAQSVLFRDELEQALRRVGVEDFGLTCCHTVGDFELLAWGRYLAKVKFSGHLLILLRQTPGYAASGRLKRLLHPYWRLRPQALKALHARLGDRFVLLTDSEPLTEDYQRVHGGRVVTAPIPINRHILEAVEEGSLDDRVRKRFGISPARGLRVGYMGDARAAKGFGLLPRLVQRVLAEAAEEVQFILQCPGSASGVEDGHGPPGVRELRQLAGPAEHRLCLVDEKLSEADYAMLFHRLDVVLLPYQSPLYAEATSGIFAEAVALGKPVVVPSGTWMSRELGRAGSGVVFERGSEEDLAKQVLSLVRNYPQHAERARQTRDRWRALHNADTLARLLLREAKLAPGAEAVVDESSADGRALVTESGIATNRY